MLLDRPDDVNLGRYRLHINAMLGLADKANEGYI